MPGQGAIVNITLVIGTDKNPYGRRVRGGYLFLWDYPV